MNIKLTRRTFTTGLLGGASVLALGLPTFAREAKKLTMPFQVGVNGLDNLDPRVLLTDAHQSVQTGIFESLVRSIGPDFKPGAAETWEVSPDGKTYTFHLRDAKWSDGKPVVAGDFVHAFQRMFISSAASQIYDAILNGA